MIAAQKELKTETKLNGRENLFKIFRHEMPEYLPKFSDTVWLRLPGDLSLTPGEGFDSWGVRWVAQDGAGQMVDETYPYVLTDLADWQDQVKIPDPWKLMDWEAEAAKECSRWNRETQMGVLILFEGHFERLHDLMGFEDTLCSFAFEDDEDDLRDLFAAITDFKIEQMKIAKKYYDPDMICYHDDWGTNNTMFFRPEKWHSIIKDEFKRLVSACHDLGMLFELHSCGHIQEVVRSCVEECGIDCIQTLMYPQNDIEMIKREVGDKLVIRGGYDGRSLLRPDVSEDEKRRLIRYSLSVLVPGGNHIPYFYAFGSEAASSEAFFEQEVSAWEAQNGSY